MESPHEANPLASLVVALQEEVAQLKEEIRKRDSMPDHIRVLQLEARLQELEKENAQMVHDLQQSLCSSNPARREQSAADPEPDFSPAQFVLQYDPVDQNAFLESGIPRASADLVACFMGPPDKQEFFCRAITLVETAAHARLNSTLAGHEIYSPAESGIIVAGFQSANAGLKVLADALASCYLKLHLSQFTKIAKLLISSIVSTQGSSIASRFQYGNPARSHLDLLRPYTFLRFESAAWLIIASHMGMSSIDDVLRFFNECTDALSRNGVFPWVMRQVIAQLILFISTHLFNQVIKVPELCTATVGLSIRFLMSELQRWLASRGEAGSILEYCMEIAQPLAQLASLLIMDKSNLMYAALFSSERNLALYFPALNAQQVHKVLSQFTPDSSCPNAISPDVANKVVSFAAKSPELPLLLDMKRMVTVEELRTGSLNAPARREQQLPLIQPGDDEMLTWVLNSPRKAHRRAAPPDAASLQSLGAANMHLIAVTGDTHVTEFCSPNCFTFAPPKLEDEERMQLHYRDSFISRPHYHIVGTGTEQVGAVVVTVEEAMPLQQRVRALIRTGELKKLQGNRHITLAADDVVRELRQNVPGLHNVPLSRIATPEMNAALLEYESNLVERSYKFAVLLCRPGQTAEHDWYRNAEVPDSLEVFLSLLGRRIELKGWSAYTGGLDTSDNLTGTYSYYTKFANVDIMFHVAPLLPLRDDPQQVDKKRHLGNDVCMIVFREEGCVEPFRPESVRSHFNHVFAVVEPDTTGSTYDYKVAFVTKKDVPPFGPPLPVPGRFKSSGELRDFLLTKLINGERAAVVHAHEFQARARRARGSALQHLINQHRASST